MQGKVRDGHNIRGLIGVRFSIANARDCEKTEDLGAGHLLL